MPKKFFKRLLPDKREFKQKNSAIRVLGEHVHRSGLWHLNRHSVSKAFAIGFFCMWLPIPFQTIIAAVLAVLFVANLPLSIILVFITNPVTIPPMFYLAYRTGSFLLGLESQPFTIELSVEWLGHFLQASWKPLVLGSLLLGIVSSAIGYVTVKLLWRLHIIQRWQNRKSK